MSSSKRFAAVLIAAALIPAAGAAQEPDFSGVYNFVEISDRLSTSGQISLDDIGSVDAAGFDVVVNLAPARWERNFEEGFRVTQGGDDLYPDPGGLAGPLAP